jgi:spore germination cell wall hydrolase CwlJ-like protein
MLLTASALCLALNVYHEARGEPVNGQVAVAFVTLNRVEKQQSNVCSVVYQHKQFSWTNDRLITKTTIKNGKCINTKTPNPKWHVRYDVNTKSKAWEQAVYVALYTLKHNKSDITNGSTHYHATYVDPYWRTAYQEVMKIGHHIFYKKT